MNKLFLLYFGLLPLSSLVGKTIYVNLSSTGSNNGGSWATAFKHLDIAINSAENGDEIWVASGTYFPSTQSSSQFEINKNIKLFGGFYGNETNIAQRNIEANITTLTIKPNVYSRVLYFHNTDTTTMIDGFTISGGYSIAQDIPGGGLLLYSNDSDSPAYLNVINCKFIDNTANLGGAIGLQSLNQGIGAIYIDGCIFESNFASRDGGALYLETGDSVQHPVIIKNSTFKDNFAGWSAGAIAYGSFSLNSIFRVESCKFIENSAITSFGAIGYFSNSKIKGKILNTFFERNTGGTVLAVGGAGGGVGGDNIQFIGCAFLANRAFRGGAVSGLSNVYLNCLFAKNYAGAFGGAIAFLGESSVRSSKFVNCTFFKNYAEDKGGAILIHHSTRDTFYNSVFYGNSADNSGDLMYSQFGGANIYSDHILWDLNDCTEVLSLSNPGVDTVNCGANILFDADNPFVDTASSNFHLLGCSPGIDFANSEYLPLDGLAFDLDSNQRILNTTLDLGAYEQEKFNLKPYFTIINESDDSMDGAILLDSILGPSSSYQYTWNTGQNDASIYNLTHGIYTVTISDLSGCDTVLTFEIGKSAHYSNLAANAQLLQVYPTIASSGTPVTIRCAEFRSNVIEIRVVSYDGKIIKQYSHLCLNPLSPYSIPIENNGTCYIIIITDQGECYSKLILRS